MSSLAEMTHRSREMLRDFPIFFEAEQGPLNNLTIRLEHPYVSQALQVYVTDISDPDNIAAAAVFYSVNGGAWQQTGMAGENGGRFSAVVPGQADGAVMKRVLGIRRRSAGARRRCVHLAQLMTNVNGQFLSSTRHVDRSLRADLGL